MELNERIYIEDDNGVDINALLDELGIDYDYDSGDRLMIAEEDVDDVLIALEDAGVEANLI